MVAPMILIDALYINKGGGAVLLDYLVQKVDGHPQRDRFYFLFDPRYAIPAGTHVAQKVLPNSQRARMAFYKTNKSQYTAVFCFANTPPPVRLPCRVYTYFHNQKLLEAPSRKFEKNYRKIYLKYLVVKWFARNTDYFIVQTPHMVKELVHVGLKGPRNCLMLPFYDNSKYLVGSTPFEERSLDSFVFISNPSPQKNYPKLLDAWELLAAKRVFPLLHVTIDDTAPDLLERLAQMHQKGIRINNHVYIDPRGLYFNCAYLIFPSLVESFGLPLIEAVDSGMKILASDRDFVYDVVQPSGVFDPTNPDSIAAAVEHALKAELPFPKLVTYNAIEELLDLLLG
jgi:glycosyltransferase involved in cell wall biosynthesis